MMTTLRIERLLDAGHHTLLLGSILDNGRPVNHDQRRRLEERAVLPVAAEAMALLRAVELSFGPNAAVARLASRLLDRQEPSTGDFGVARGATNDAAPRGDDRRAIVTALCVRALIEALRRDALDADLAVAAHAGVRGGLRFLEAATAASRGGGDERSPRVTIDELDVSLLRWLLSDQPEGQNIVARLQQPDGKASPAKRARAAAAAIEASVPRRSGSAKSRGARRSEGTAATDATEPAPADVERSVRSAWVKRARVAVDRRQRWLFDVHEPVDGAAGSGTPASVQKAATPVRPTSEPTRPSQRRPRRRPTANAGPAAPRGR